MAQLVFRYDDGGEERFPLEDDEIDIGRDAENPIVIDNNFISAKHARMNRDSDGSWSIMDLGSNNGTYVNDRAISTAHLEHGDTLRFGVCEVIFYHADEPAVAWPDPAPEPEPEPEYAQDDNLTQRISLEVMAQQSYSYWNAMVENKRAELEAIEQRIEARETEEMTVHREDEMDREERQRRRGEQNALKAEVQRLEVRLEEVQSQLMPRTERLDTLVQREIPLAERKLESLQEDIAQTLNELKQHQLREAAAREQSQEIVEVEKDLEFLRAQQQEFLQEREMRRQALEQVLANLQRKQGEMDEMQVRLDLATQEENSLLKRLGSTREQLVQLQAEAQQKESATQRTRDELEEVTRKLQGAQEARRELDKEHEAMQESLRAAQEKLRIIEERSASTITHWDVFERTQLEQLLLNKAQLEKVILDSDSRLENSRQQLEEARSQIKAETAEAERALQDLRANHYEPLQQQHEELTNRRDQLVKELAQMEERRTELEAAVQENASTEELIGRKIERRGEELFRLEQRVGEEVARIRAEVGGTSTASLGTGRIPSTSPLVARLPGTPPMSAASHNGSARTPITVFDPRWGEKATNYGDGVVDPYRKPLPPGLAGVSAATRGSLQPSLSRAAAQQTPVLLVLGNNPESNVVRVKKLRSAMPTGEILLGWKKESFEATLDSLQEGANFQFFIAMLERVNGHVLTDPMMKTFFESLGQQHQYCVIPGALPWSSRERRSHGERYGIYLDVAGYEPEDLTQQGIIRELREIAKSSRQSISIPNVSDEVVSALTEQLDLNDDYVRVLPRHKYPRYLGRLEEHLAVVSCVAPSLETPVLRDALLAGSFLIAPGSEVLQTFFPDTLSMSLERTLPESQLMASLLNSEEHFLHVMKQADRTLLEDYSYQAASRKISTLLRQKALV